MKTIRNNTVKTVSQLRALSDQYGSRLFIRWCRGPGKDAAMGGRSSDAISGATHTGLSAIEIDPEWFGYPDEWYLLKRLGEYRFLRIKDARIRLWLYVADKIGTDSDGYDLIEQTGEAWRLDLEAMSIEVSK